MVVLGDLGSKKHLDRLEIDLSAAKIRTVQDYIHTKNNYEWKYKYIVRHIYE